MVWREAMAWNASLASASGYDVSAMILTRPWLIRLSNSGTTQIVRPERREIETNHSLIVVNELANLFRLQ